MGRRRAVFAAAASLLLGATGEPERPVTMPFGTLPDGRAVARHTLTNANGMIVDLVDHGAAIARVATRNADGRLVDLVVGPADLAGFVASKRRFGAIVGRYAGRLRGMVTVDGVGYPLATNATGVTLHGGDPGFDRALWAARPVATADATGIDFRYTSQHGDQGFPGRLAITARYRLARRADVLTLDITATSDRPTVANVTNHVYFNLAGSGSVACHALRIDAARRVAVDARKLPTGVLEPVRGSLDFRKPGRLGDVLATGGIDEMFVLNRGGSALLTDRHSGRWLRVTTDRPGIQAFTGNAFDGTDRDRSGDAIARFGGIALEPGHFADSPWFAHFPSTRVAPGRPLRWHARWQFGRSTVRDDERCK